MESMPDNTPSEGSMDKFNLSSEDFDELFEEISLEIDFDPDTTAEAMDMLSLYEEDIVNSVVDIIDDPEETTDEAHLYAQNYLDTIETLPYLLTECEDLTGDQMLHVIADLYLRLDARLSSLAGKEAISGVNKDELLDMLRSRYAIATHVDDFSTEIVSAIKSTLTFIIDSLYKHREDYPE